MPHPIHIGLPRGNDESQHKCGHDTDYHDYSRVHPPGPLPIQNGTQRPGEQRQDDGHEREILHESHYFPSFFNWVLISSKSSVWYLRYRRMVRDSISAVTDTDTTMPVSTSPLGMGLI